uniref:NADH-ubiquinone oxidoreductase chain 4L n=1 Tax=Gammarus pisinnus TaxID=1486748 RepID=A0A517LS64_9CRUS|nr:NADH dehydrogenase subunit 4L [Gammarus pisinnus]QDS78472.1 NADH dehydrogenase subunit 4L [Gammarus pisinnus]
MMTIVEMSVLMGLLTGSFSYILNYSHLLMSLLSLELISLMVYWGMSLMILSMGEEVFFLLFYLVMTVCEGTLGLSLLISCVHSFGSDRMKIYSSLGC